VKNHYEYVIIGAGTTAYAAIETIFNNKPDADLLLLSNEAVRGVALLLPCIHYLHLFPSFAPPLAWLGREGGLGPRYPIAWRVGVLGAWCVVHESD
jgi:hypothetical protein